MAAVLIHFRYLPPAQPSEHTAFGCTIPRFGQSRGLALGMVQRAGKSPAVWPYGLLEALVKDFGTRSKLVVLLLLLGTLLGCSGSRRQPAFCSNDCRFQPNYAVSEERCFR